MSDVSLPDVNAAALRRVWLIACAGVCAMAALLAYLPAGGHDQLWCLYVARHMRAGEALYGPTLFESNPPLILWLSMVPVVLAGWLHVGAAAVGKVLVIALQAGVAAVAWRQLRRLALRREAVGFLALVALVLWNVVPARDLGQRDYLLALLCVPYLLNAAALAVGREAERGWWAWGIGVAAGVGLGLKPHEAVLPIVVEVLLLVERRTWRTLLRPEPLAIVAVGLAYVAAIWKLTPLYLSDVLPILRDTYWAVGGLSFGALVLESVQLHVLGALAWLAWMRVRADARWAGSPVPCLLAAGGASTLAYYLQGTGWYYQQLPAITFFGLALAFVLVPLVPQKAPLWMPNAVLALTLLAVGLTTHFMGYPFTLDRSFAIETPDPAFFEGLAPGATVATLTTTVDYTVMPAERFGLTVAQRYPHLWMLPAILRLEQPGRGDRGRQHTVSAERLEELDAQQHAFMAEDLARWKPELVLVERCQKPNVNCQLLEKRDDDVLAWFLRDQAVAEEWKAYSFAGARGHFDAYVRKPEP